MTQEQKYVRAIALYSKQTIVSPFYVMDGGNANDTTHATFSRHVTNTLIAQITVSKKAIYE